MWFASKYSIYSGASHHKIWFKLRNVSNSRNSKNQNNKKDGPFLMKVYYVLTFPFAVYFILSSKDFLRRINLTFFKIWSRHSECFLTNFTSTGTSYKISFGNGVMKIFETPWKLVWLWNVERGKGSGAVIYHWCADNRPEALIFLIRLRGLPERKKVTRKQVNYKTGGGLFLSKRSKRKHPAIRCNRLLRI